MAGATLALADTVHPSGGGRVVPVSSRHWPRRERLLGEEDCTRLIARIKTPYLKLVDRQGVANSSLLLNNWLLPLAAWLCRYRFSARRSVVLAVAGAPAVSGVFSEMLQLVLQQAFHCEVTVRVWQDRLSAASESSPDGLVLLSSPGAALPRTELEADVVLLLDHGLSIRGVDISARPGAC